jgi:hypothetical protein
MPTTFETIDRAISNKENKNVDDNANTLSVDNKVNVGIVPDVKSNDIYL